MSAPGSSTVSDDYRPCLKCGTNIAHTTLHQCGGFFSPNVTIQEQPLFTYTSPGPNPELLSALAWAVGKLEGLGQEAGHARNVMEKYLARPASQPDGGTEK